MFIFAEPDDCFYLGTVYAYLISEKSHEVAASVTFPLIEYFFTFIKIERLFTVVVNTCLC